MECTLKTHEKDYSKSEQDHKKWTAKA